MNIIYANQPFNSVKANSLFLAGPTPRYPDVKSWRPEALQILQELEFDGTVFVPERLDKSYDYLQQVEWEYVGLENAKIIVFWVPRDLVTLPAFTTNTEFGRYVGSGRAIYGRPDNSPKNRYLDWLYEKVTGKTPFNNLRNLLKEVVERTKND